MKFIKINNISLIHLELSIKHIFRYKFFRKNLIINNYNINSNFL